MHYQLYILFPILFLSLSFVVTMMVAPAELQEKVVLSLKNAFQGWRNYVDDLVYLLEEAIAEMEQNVGMTYMDVVDVHDDGAAELPIVDDSSENLSPVANGTVLGNDTELANFTAKVNDTVLANISRVINSSEVGNFLGAIKNETLIPNITKIKDFLMLAKEAIVENMTEPEGPIAVEDFGAAEIVSAVENNMDPLMTNETLAIQSDDVIPALLEPVLVVG